MNLYNYKGRHVDNSDLMQVVIKQNKNIKYYIWIGKQYPKSFCTKEQPFHIENSIYFKFFKLFKKGLKTVLLILN